MRNLVKTLLALSVLAVLAACPKNKNDDVVTPVVNGYQSCTNCGGLVNGQEFLSTDSQDLNNLFTLRLGFSGSSTNVNGFGYGPSQYSGPVAVSRGELVIQQGLYQGSCLVPAGTYSVGTINIGNYNGRIITNLKLLASGSASITIQIDAAQIASPTNRDQWGMLLLNQRLFSSRTVIESVNGQYCYAPVSYR